MRNLLTTLFSFFSGLFSKKKPQPAPPQKPEILEEDWHEGPIPSPLKWDKVNAPSAADFEREYLNKPPPPPSDPLLKLWLRCQVHMTRNGMVVDFEPGGGNIIFVSGYGLGGQPNDNKHNLWNDLVFIARKGEFGWNVVFAAECTTAPGTLPAFSKTALQRGGIARVVPNQYFAWMHGFHKKSKYGEKHPAFVQREPVTITRDFNQDLSTAGDKVYTGKYGINIHAQPDGKDAELVNFNSEGCLVLRHFNELQEMREITKDFNSYKKTGPGTIFAATIIEGSALPA